MLSANMSADVLAEADNIIDAGTRESAPATKAAKASQSKGRAQRKTAASSVSCRGDTKPIMAFFSAGASIGISRDGFDGTQGSGAPECHSKGAADSVICCHCGSHDIITRMADSMRLCTSCDAVEFIVIDNERPAKRDAPKDSASFSFKRLSHFNEWLAQIQGKDNPSIPEEIIGFVMAELRRHHIVNAADINASQVRAILKKLKLSRYYEHVPYIISRIRGVPSERMPAALEEKLRHMFRKIQVPFVRHSPATRKNFLSYGYVLHKFVQLLGEDDYLSKFPLLKSREKLRMQDSIWKAICNDLDWEFIPSI